MRSAWLLLLAACAAPAPRGAAGPAVPPPLTAAQTAEWRRLLLEALREPSSAEQADMAVSEQFTLQAKAWIDKGDFEKGRVALQEAHGLFADVNEILTGEPRGLTDFSGRFRVQIEQALLEVGNHIRNGERLYNAREFEAAVREFEEADFKIKHMPYEVGVLGEVQPRVAESLKRARSAAKKD